MAKKIIRLTESDLELIVKRVIAEQSIKVNASIDSSPEAILNFENGKKTILVRSTMGFEDQKFEIETQFPIKKKDQAVYVVYKGNGEFELYPEGKGAKPIMGKVIRKIN